MTNPYAPVEPPVELRSEQLQHAATAVGAIAYGIHVTVFFMCAHQLLKKRKQHFEKWLIFIFLLFSLGTLSISIDIRSDELAWIDNRNFPGGPLAYFAEIDGGSKLLIAGTAGTVLITVLADGLMIYRCHSLYRRWWLLIILIMAWLASLVCGILARIRAFGGDGIFKQSAINFSLPYWSLSMSLNTLLTTLLIARLLYMRRCMKEALGSNYARLYKTVAVILADSALPYGLISLVFVVLYGTGNTGSLLFLPLVVQAECISPMVIILRVTRGKTWSEEVISRENLTENKFKIQQQFKAGTSSNTSENSGTPQNLSMITFKPGDVAAASGKGRGILQKSIQDVAEAV